MHNFLRIIYIKCNLPNTNSVINNAIENDAEFHLNDLKHSFQTILTSTDED